MNGIIYARFILGIILLLISLTLFIIQMLGVFKMRYVMNRMHLAAIGDALALGLAFLGLIILNGVNFTTLKLLLVPAFMFCTSPVSSHLIARMEIETGSGEMDDKFRNVEVRELDKLKEEM